MNLVKRGFLSAELAIVIVVSILLLLGVVYKGSEALNNSRITKATTVTAYIGSLVNEYNMEIGHYPASLNNLTMKEGDYGPWVGSIANDPWGHAYVYQYNENGFVIYSCGKDGRSHGSTINGIAKGDIGFRGK